MYVVESSKNTSAIKADILKNNRIDIFYGDTESDYKAACDAGCSFKAVYDGFRSGDFWRQYGVELVDLNKLKH